MFLNLCFCVCYWCFLVFLFDNTFFTKPAPKWRWNHDPSRKRDPGLVFGFGPCCPRLWSPREFNKSLTRMDSHEHPGQTCLDIARPLSLRHKTSDFNKSPTRMAWQDHLGQKVIEITWTTSPGAFAAAPFINKLRRSYGHLSTNSYTREPSESAGMPQAKWPM